MSEKFSVLRVDREQAISMESVGSKRKFWFSHKHKRLIFKAEERETGEDWAEVVSAELCELLGLPHVKYELAQEFFEDNYKFPGVVSERLITWSESLILGNALLLVQDPSYPTSQRRKVRQHSRLAVTDAVWNFRPPRGEELMPEACRTAGGAFIGYLLLDAWIANTDRHHENWGVVWDGDVFRLASTFDHGAALAHNLLDEERVERMTTKDRNRTVQAFAERGESALYLSDDEAKPMKLLEAFEVFAEYAPEAGRAWLERLSRIGLDDLAKIVDRVPDERITTTCRDFTLKLLEINQRRLLDLDI